MDDRRQLLRAPRLPVRGKGGAPKGGTKAREMKKKEFVTGEEGLRLAELWARDGEDDRAIARRFGLPERLLRRLRRESPALDTAIREGRAAAWRVETALLDKATGYDKPVQKVYKLKTVEFDPETGKKLCEREELKTAEEAMHVPGNTTAQVFWLKNRRPDRWRDKPGVPDGAGEDDDGLYEALAEAVRR